MGVNTAVITQQAPITNGTQNFTQAGFGTPTAAIAFATLGDVNDGTVVDRAAISIALSDMTNTYCVSHQADHGSGTQFTDRMGRTGELVALMDTAQALDWAGNNNGTVTDGLQIDWVTTQGSDAPIVTVILFNGTDLTVGIDEGTTPSAGTPQPVAIGFEPDLVFGITNRTASGEFDPEEVTANWGLSVAFITNNGGVTHRSANTRASDNVGTSLGSILNSTTACFVNLNASTVGARYEAEGFDTAGFDLDRKTSSGRISFAFLGLAFGGAVNFKVGHISAPATAVETAYTDPGFKPQLVLAALTTDVNVDETYDMTNQFGFGMGAFGRDIDTQACASVASEENQATTDTQSLADAVFCNLAGDDGTTVLDASLVSRDPTGFTLDFTTTTNNLKILYMAIEDDQNVPNVVNDIIRRVEG